MKWGDQPLARSAGEPKPTDWILMGAILGVLVVILLWAVAVWIAPESMATIILGGPK